MQVGDKIPCDKDATVRAQYIIQGEELNSGQEVLDFFYLVCVKGYKLLRIVTSFPVLFCTNTVHKNNIIL